MHKRENLADHHDKKGKVKHSPVFFILQIQTKKLFGGRGELRRALQS